MTVKQRVKAFKVKMQFCKELNSSGSKWLPGQIQEVRGLVTYTVLLQDGRVIERHIDHIRSRTVNIDDDQPDDAGNVLYPLLSNSSSTTSTELTDMPSVTPSL